MIYNIDLGEALETAHAAVRRASAFMILGLRSLGQPMPAVMRLESSIMGFFPEPIDDGARAAISDEYRSWVVGAALRELEQGYSIFIDKLYQSCVVARGGPASLIPSLKASRKVARNANLRRKLELLRDEFSVSSRMIDFTEGFVKARNALAHAAGQVRPDDADDTGMLVIRWFGVDVEIIGNSTRVVEAVFREGHAREHLVMDPDGATVQFRVVSREKAFSASARIDLSPHDLHEICNSFLLDADNLVAQTAAVISAFGIPATLPPRPATRPG